MIIIIYFVNGKTSHHQRVFLFSSSLLIYLFFHFPSFSFPILFPSFLFYLSSLLSSSLVSDVTSSHAVSFPFCLLKLTKRKENELCNCLKPYLTLKFKFKIEIKIRHRMKAINGKREEKGDNTNNNKNTNMHTTHHMYY